MVVTMKTMGLRMELIGATATAVHVTMFDGVSAAAIKVTATTIDSGWGGYALCGCDQVYTFGR